MIKNKVLFVGMLGTVLGSIAVINASKQCKDKEFTIAFLDNYSKEVVKNLSAVKLS